MKNKGFEAIYNDVERLKYEDKCLKLLEKQLLKLGYPKEAFHYPFHFDAISCDLLIQNPSTEEPLISFEIKTKEVLREHGYQYYRRHQIENVLFYFVYLDNEDLKLCIMPPNITQIKFLGKLQINNSSTLPTYEEVVKQHLLSKREKKKKKIKQKKDLFSLWCYSVTVILIILFILELLDVFKWTTERIIVLGIIILLPLLPLFAEIKVGDYTFKRKKQE